MVVAAKSSVKTPSQTPASSGSTPSCHGSTASARKLIKALFPLMKTVIKSASIKPSPQAALDSSCPPIAKSGSPTKGTSPSALENRESIPEESDKAVPDNFSRGIRHGIRHASNIFLVLQDIKSHAEDSDDTAALTDNQEPPIVLKETVDEDIGTNDDVDIRNDGTETLIAEMDDASIEPPPLVPRSPEIPATRKSSRATSKPVRLGTTVETSPTPPLEPPSEKPPPEPPPDG